jgi:hypothetical protein
MEFVSSIVSSLAWPAVAAVAIVVLRKNLRNLVEKVVERVPDLAEISALGAHLKFEKSLTELEKDAQVIAVEAEGSATAQTPEVTADAEGALGANGTISATAEVKSAIDDEFQANVLPRNPRGTVMSAYRQVQKAAADALGRHTGIRPAVYRVSPRTVALQLTEGELDPQLEKVLLDLRKTRNLASHEESAVTPEAADRYARVAERAVEYFAQL